MARNQDEVTANFARFFSQWKQELQAAIDGLAPHEAAYLESYQRITSLHAWRVYVVEPNTSHEASRFFVEAQNDALSSHVFARIGSWRASLKFLRSCLENVLHCQFYKDHPVELKLWSLGAHRLGFNDLLGYFRKHPGLQGLGGDVTGLDRLEREYATLSRAVHASAPSFRMTPDDGTTYLWSSHQSRLGAWGTREKQTFVGLNLFLVALHHDALRGTGLPGLRESIAYTITTDELRIRLKERFGVVLPAAP